MIVALIVTLLPVSLGNQVQAATGAGSFFPDSAELGKTANFIDLKDNAASDAGLQRANVYISSGKKQCRSTDRFREWKAIPCRFE